MKLLTGIFILIVSTRCLGQTPVYDALKLTELHAQILADCGSDTACIRNTDLALQQYYGILKNYVPTPFPVKNAQMIRRYFLDNNPFFLLHLPTPSNTLASFDIESIVKAASSGIGGLDVTTFADGLAKFLVKRTKEELSVSFFVRFKKIIDSTEDLQTLFPQTSRLLGGIGSEIYNYERYIQTLREAFKHDISDLVRHLPGIVENHPVFFEQHLEERAMLLSSCYVANELENQTHPGDIIASYPVQYLEGLNKNYKGAIQSIQLISGSLKSSNEAGPAPPYWVDIKDIRTLVTDKTGFKIYLGLVYQQAINKYDSVQFDNTSLVNILSKVAGEYDKGSAAYEAYKSYILRFGGKIDALNKMIESHNHEAADSAAFEQYAKYFRASVDLLEYSSEISDLPFVRNNTAIGDLRVKLRPYFEISYSTADMVVDINRRNYSSAINHAVHIYNVVRVRPVEAISSPQTSIAQNLNNPPKTLANLLKYGSFMATMATAKNSDEVENVIQTFALPTGSSRVKRVSDFNVSLNAYVGVFAGYEKIRGHDTGKVKLNSFGITAPVGVAASWGHRLLFFPTAGEWSTSIFISIIDIGAVGAFRFRDDSTAQVPTIQLKNILSPGVFLSIGIPKTPLSVNLGTQLGPNLRKVNTGKTNVTIDDPGNKVYSRFSVSVCVDIPLLNFYTRSGE